MDDKPRFLTAAEVKPLQKRAQAHQRQQAEENVGRVVEAYKKGSSPQQREELIAQALDHSKASSSEAQTPPASETTPNPSAS